ncbi:hypothetical protein F5J12DRAFT_799434 [Pisolithus orientalis]|uniref:uncharacterized protein n=1 Tax=Pisolithus orientalis TaxID=936130 RepID=UPI0022243273|nr:uncharacterized protein F5J12DRAFT_799434 [Pisolithus orientalis]KAI6033203.1 hypothetical protein F5J12DRAFT_799434 [Pisolithus orientalis]
MPPSNQTSKLVSLMKQHAAITASISTSRATIAGLSSADRSVIFPDHAPPSPDRFAEWGRAAGMEAFVDSPGGSSMTTIVLAGKVLVLDVDIDGRVLVKTSFAIGNNVPNGTAVAPELDAFLAREVSRWVEAAKYASQGESFPSMPGEPAVVAAICARTLLGHMRYLKNLDSLADSEGERGIRWFMEPVVALQHFMSKAGDQYPSGSKTVPLDKLLVQRAFPILYLNFPSLLHLRGATGQTDIPLAHLTTSLVNEPKGATVASLKLVPSSEVSIVGAVSEGQNDHPFPSSPLHSWILDFSRSPSIYQGHGGIVMSQTRMRAIQGILGIDVATDIIMSIGTPAGASGMGPFGSMPSMSQLNFNNFGASQATTVESLSSIRSSWVDLLFNPTSSAEHYRTTYRSPSGVHPPLNLRLSVPQEPGFLLQRVPVRTTNQVSRVLEIVREQCWLNELLLMSQWQPEDTAALPKDSKGADLPSSTGAMGADATELLASLLEGSFTPKSIPVSVFLPSTSLPPLAHFSGLGPPPVSGGTSDSLFGTGDMDMDMEIPGLSMSMNSSMEIGIDARMGMEIGGGVNMGGMGSMGIDFSGSVSPPRQPPMIILSSPAKAPTVDLVELRVSFVPGSSTGAGSVGLGNEGGDCRVKVEASPGVDTKGMDEIVRRVWTKNHK